MPSGPVAITLSNVLTDVERDFFAREVEAGMASGSVEIGTKRWRFGARVVFGALAALAGIGAFAVVQAKESLGGRAPTAAAIAAPTLAAATPPKPVVVEAPPSVSPPVAAADTDDSAPALRAHPHRGSRHAARAHHKHKHKRGGKSRSHE